MEKFHLKELWMSMNLVDTFKKLEFNLNPKFKNLLAVSYYASVILK